MLEAVTWARDFGALGLLAAQSFTLLRHGLTPRQLAARGVLSWCLLLVLLGFSPARNVDVLAHVAGFVAGVETGLKAFYKDHFYFNLAGKACYADYKNALGLGNGKVSHHFFAYEALFTFGYQLAL